MTDNLKQITVWGRPISELTREELIHAIELLAEDMEQMRETHKKDIDFMNDLYKARLARQ